MTRVGYWQILPPGIAPKQKQEFLRGMKPGPRPFLTNDDCLFGSLEPDDIPHNNFALLSMVFPSDSSLQPDHEGVVWRHRENERDGEGERGDFCSWDYV